MREELLRYIEREGDIHAPRIYHLYQAIRHAETETELHLMLISAFMQLDKDLTATTKELIHEKAHSTRTTIRIDSN